MADLTMNEEDLELTALEILSRGEDLLAIGAWEAPVKRLAMQGLAMRVGSGYRITDKGLAFFAKQEGLTDAEAVALSPPRPDWIATPIPDGGLVILRKNELTVSGYEAMIPRWLPVVHGRLNDADTVAIPTDARGFLQAMLDAAWGLGLRPSGAVNDNAGQS